MIAFDAIEIGRYISKGSKGVVSEVKIERTIGQYVVKMFYPRSQKYDQETIKLMLQLKHPNIIQI